MCVGHAPDEALAAAGRRSPDSALTRIGSALGLSVPGFQGRLCTSPEALDAASGSTGPVRIRPRAVAHPSGVPDLQALVRFASKEGWSLIPRGAATGMPGGNVGPGMVVDLRGDAFQVLDPVDRERRTIRAGAGVTLSRVIDVARSAGLDFPPAPSSASRCSVGGVAANNAAGARSFRHGSARSWVSDVDAVLPEGELFRCGDPAPPPFQAARLRSEGEPTGPGWPQVRKNSSGYALKDFVTTGQPSDLLVGSEGTIGLLTAVEFRLRPLPAERRVSVVALPNPDVLDRLSQTVETLGASACEFLGRSLLQLGNVEADPLVGDMTSGAWGLAIIEFEGGIDEVESSTEELMREVHGLGVDIRAGRNEEESQGLWDVRHRASPTIAARAGAGRVSMQFIEDCVVPRPRLPAYLSGLAHILEDAGLEAVVFGHAGDGNVHVNPLVPIGDEDWRPRVRRVLEAVTDLVSSLGGTLSGEHGDGRIRAPFLSRIWPSATVSAFEAVKSILDPAGIFNPGVILPLPGQDPLEGLGC